MRRILLFLATNMAIVLLLSVTASLLGVNRYLSSQGIHFGALLGFAAIMGFGGAFISLWMSKSIAQWSTQAQVITHPQSNLEHWLLNTVAQHAKRANIAIPEVAIYEGAPNAFATGASKNNSLVAVSTGLLQAMTQKEIEAVLAHEVAHIANGDMVTMTLIQGVVNTFVIFLARLVGFLVDQMLRKNDENNSGPGIGYAITVFICEALFSLVASLIVMYFSRQREFRADAGAAQILGTPAPMIAALRRLAQDEPGQLPQNMAALGIAGGPGWMEWFASHPPIEQRISALQH